MKFNPKKIEEYKNKEWVGHVPEHPEGVGTIKDNSGKAILSISCSADRDIITDIGLKVHGTCSDHLLAAASVAVGLAKDQAILKAELIAPDDLFRVLLVNGDPDDEDYYDALLTILCLKDALSSYADYRRREKRETKPED